MKRIIYIYLLAVVSLGFTACKKYLDVVPKGKIIPKKTEDYRLLLNQMNPNGKSKGFVNSFSNDVLMADDMDVNAFSANFYNATNQNVLTFAEHIYQDFESDPDWEALYNQIYVTNLVISEVMDAEGGTTEEKNQLLAEARVHRAHALLLLVNLYAKQYNPATAASDDGVSLRPGLDFEENLKRASVQEVYDFIVNDLKLSIGHLPNTPMLNYNYRPVEPAAYALLARANLYMNNTENALKYADSSLILYNTLIDFNTLEASNMIPGTLLYPIGLQNPEVLLLKSTTSPTSLFYANTDLINLFDITDDLRVPAMYFSDALFGMDFGYISTEWTGRTPVKGPSTAEMYLVRAECYARQGKTAEAINDLNTLRASRFKTGSDYELTATSPQEALTLVKTERRRELAFRGFRLFDIKRYNVFDHDNISVTRTINGAVYTLLPESPRMVLPIGRKYIELNPEINPNPR